MKFYGRIPHFDDRSRQHPIRTAIANADSRPIRSYTWRCSRTLDQGMEGACVGFAWAHELIARPAECSWLTNEDARRIYHDAQRLDPWDGGAYPGARPFYEGTAVLAGAKAAMVTGLISGYRWAFGIEDLLLGISYHGPAVLGINWYEGLNRPDENGVVRKTGIRVGGHAILCRAYNAQTEMLTLRNSWGSQWGINGDCYISLEDMVSLLYEEGEAVFALGRRSEAVQHHPV